MTIAHVVKVIPSADFANAWTYPLMFSSFAKYKIPSGLEMIPSKSPAYPLIIASIGV